MVPKKCRLCSKLSSALDWLSNLFLKPTVSSKQLSALSLGAMSVQGSLCQQTNEVTIEDRNRVQTFSKECPDCLCEKFTSSPHSPGLIEDAEKLTRFVFSPVHVSNKGKIKPSVFSHVFSVGCSIQRESIVSDAELINFVKSYSSKNPEHSWYGVLTADCAALRSITMDNSDKRIVCVYDMAEKDNQAHGEIHQSQYEIDEADRPELRAKLFEAFNSGVKIEPAQYRNGSVLANI